MAKPKVWPFASYEPDRGAGSGAGTVARGVLSQGGRYVPLPSLETYRAGSILNSACLGAFGCYDSTGQPTQFAGDVSRLYRIVAKAPADVSGSTYAADPDWQWSFAQFGDNVIAAARGVTMQRYVIGTSSTFADVAGAPTAEVVFRVRSHMFACSGRTVNWSAFNDVTDWTPDSATQAGNTTIGQDAGIVVAGIGGEQGTIFQERGIVRLAYTGGDTIWYLDEVEGGRGACSPGAVCRWGRGAFVCAEDGFYFWDGLNAEPIGQNKVDREFTGNLNYAYRGRITSAIDAHHRCWMVAYPTGGSSTCNKVLIYSWADNRWTHDEIDIQALLEMPRDGVSADDQTAIELVAGTAVADDITLSADSPAWRESRRGWACFDATRGLKTFTGTPRAAVMETGLQQPQVGRITHAKGMTPVIDAEPGYVAGELYVRPYRLGETDELADDADMDETGCIPVRGEGRFLKGRISVSAGAPWTEAVGLSYDMGDGGER